MSIGTSGPNDPNPLELEAYKLMLISQHGLPCIEGTAKLLAPANQAEQQLYDDAYLFFFDWLEETKMGSYNDVVAFSALMRERYLVSHYIMPWLQPYVTVNLVTVSDTEQSLASKERHRRFEGILSRHPAVMRWIKNKKLRS